MTTTQTNTREQWLNDAAEAMRSIFDEQDAKAYPKFRVSCGFPKGARGKAIGQAWHPDASSDDTVEVFISPELSDVVKVMATLLHELIHAIVGNDVGHKGPLKDLAKAVGLEGKMTATVAGEDLTLRLLVIARSLGPYPHAQLQNKVTTKQSTRMMKVTCSNPACGYIIRTTKKWIDLGLPTCYCGNEMQS